MRAIYKLADGGERVSTTALARRQGVSAASASAMVKKLAALGLAEHAPYRGVWLTEDGKRVALEVIRHHRLLELYLAETLGIHVDDVHAEADRLERMKYTCSAIMFYWGVDKVYEQLGVHNIFLSGDYRASFDRIFNAHTLPDEPSFYVHAPTRTDPAAAPLGVK